MANEIEAYLRLRRELEIARRLVQQASGQYQKAATALRDLKTLDFDDLPTEEQVRKLINNVYTLKYQLDAAWSDIPEDLKCELTEPSPFP